MEKSKLKTYRYYCHDQGTEVTRKVKMRGAMIDQTKIDIATILTKELIDRQLYDMIGSDEAKEDYADLVIEDIVEQMNEPVNDLIEQINNIESKIIIKEYDNKYGNSDCYRCKKEKAKWVAQIKVNKNRDYTENNTLQVLLCGECAKLHEDLIRIYFLG